MSFACQCPTPAELLAMHRQAVNRAASKQSCRVACLKRMELGCLPSEVPCRAAMGVQSQQAMSNMAQSNQRRCQTSLCSAHVGWRRSSTRCSRPSETKLHTALYPGHASLVALCSAHAGQHKGLSWPCRQDGTSTGLCHELCTVGTAGHPTLLSSDHCALLHCLRHLSTTAVWCLCSVARRHRKAALAILVSMPPPPFPILSGSPVYVQGGAGA